MNVSKLAPYAKTVVALCGVVLMVAKAFTDGQLTSDEVISIVTAIGVATGVYSVPNKG